jgi:NAD(P)-dependent dehydrogenase (short-subunit alcohol dehydrogenase family)
MEKRIGIITGANSGIGFASVGQIADENFHVIMACRNREKGSVALQKILKENPSRSVELMIVDMSSLESIREFVKQVKAKYRVVDLLIHNAASFDISQKEPKKSVDGLESLWATNHIGPVLLTELLLDLLMASHEGRIITIASKGLLVKPLLKIRLEDPEFKAGKFSVTNAYYQAKRAQIMYTYYMAERLKNTSVTINCIRVTNVKIDISRYPNISSFMKKIYTIKSKKSISPEQMAKTYTYVATSPKIKGVSGLYIDECQMPVKSNKYTYGTDNQRAVMKLTATYAPELKDLI